MYSPNDKTVKGRCHGSADVALIVAGEMANIQFGGQEDERLAYYDE